MNKRAKVLYDGTLAAWLSETDDGYELVYEKAWLDNDEAKPVSLTLPLQKETHRSKVLFPFFDGLIPEGWLLDIVVESWKMKPNDRFEILLTACRDTIGAVTVEPENNKR